MISRKRSDMTAEELRVLILELKDMIARTECLYQEALENERLKDVLESVFATSCCPYHSMLNGFMIGLRTGIAMESNPTGGVKID